MLHIGFTDNALKNLEFPKNHTAQPWSTLLHRCEMVGVT